MAQPLEIRGPNIRLRYAKRSDAETLLALGSDPDVTRYFSWGPYQKLAEPLAYIASLPAQRRRGERLEFVVEHTAHGVVGVTGLSEFSRRDRRAVVGTWFGRAWWGSGINAESKALIAHLAFALLGCERLSAYSHVDHERSARALQKVGFQREGTLRAFHRHGETQLDVFVWSLLHSEWKKAQLCNVDVAVGGRVPRAWMVRPRQPRN